MEEEALRTLVAIKQVMAGELYLRGFQILQN